MNIPFLSQADCFKIDVTSTASTSVSLGDVDAASVRIVNDSLSTVFISIGVGSQTATLPTTTGAGTCTPVLGGADVTLTIPRDLTLEISAIAKADETSTIYVQAGEGF